MILNMLKSCPSYIQSHLHEVVFSKGTHIIFQDTINEHVYVIKTGSVEILSYDIDGKQYSIWTQTDDSIFGEVELYSSETPMFNVVALKRTIVYKIPKYKFIKWLNDDPVFLKYTYQQLVHKLLQSSKKQISFMSKPLKERIMIVLKEKERMDILKSLTKNQLCIEVFAPVRSVNRVLNELSDVVGYEDKEFFFKN